MSENEQLRTITFCGGVPEVAFRPAPEPKRGVRHEIRNEFQPLEESAFLERAVQKLTLSAALQLGAPPPRRIKRLRNLLFKFRTTRGGHRARPERGQRPVRNRDARYVYANRTDQPGRQIVLLVERPLSKRIG